MYHETCCIKATKFGKSMYLFYTCRYAVGSFYISVNRNNIHDKLLNLEA